MDFQLTPSWREILLYVWLTSLVCEEVRQVSGHMESNRSLILWTLLSTEDNSHFIMDINNCGLNNDGSVLLLMFLLSIWVVAYGVAKQGILIQNEERFNWIVRGAVYEPLPHHIRELTSYLPRMANNNHAVYTFTEVQDNTDAIWKFQRYELIKEYHSRPSLPPPFILLSHIYLLITHVFLRRQELSQSEEEELLSWESFMKDNYLASLKQDKSQSIL
uniref:Uncharacterized protein n=1 Tax=Astyanax mexicanus TaxID=7994 RepID=A0A3B1K330_ASTMX